MGPPGFEPGVVDVTLGISRTSWFLSSRKNGQYSYSLESTFSAPTDAVLGL